MYYACGDIYGIDDKTICKNEKQKYNQCCQECSNKNTCDKHCDYAHSYECIVKYKED